MEDFYLGLTVMGSLVGLCFIVLCCTTRRDLWLLNKLSALSQTVSEV